LNTKGFGDKSKAFHLEFFQKHFSLSPISTMTDFDLIRISFELHHCRQVIERRRTGKNPLTTLKYRFLHLAFEIFFSGNTMFIFLSLYKSYLFSSC
jgi:hypothetical protein